MGALRGRKIDRPLLLPKELLLDTFGVKPELRARRRKGQHVVHHILDLQEERALMGFRETFVRLRKERGWTQQKLAENVGISLAQIKKYEKGSSAPTLPILAKLATAFGVSADELVFGGQNGLAAQKLDVELLRRFEMIAELPERERDAVLLLIDSVIAKNRLREVIGSG